MFQCARGKQSFCKTMVGVCAAVKLVGQHSVTCNFLCDYIFPFSSSNSTAFSYLFHCLKSSREKYVNRNNWTVSSSLSNHSISGHWEQQGTERRFNHLRLGRVTMLCLHPFLQDIGCITPFWGLAAEKRKIKKRFTWRLMLHSQIQIQSSGQSLVSHKAVALWVCCVKHVLYILYDWTAVLWHSRRTTHDIVSWVQNSFVCGLQNMLLKCF